MSSIYDKYEAVIGLEVHAQLTTQSKAFSNDINEYGATPNHNVSPISLGHPGTLPTFNQRSPEYGVKLGLACGSEIRKQNLFARKNYFYADLPKGYQITQFDTPICNGGTIDIKLNDGSKKSIRLTRIHMEEDSGKSIHDQDPMFTLVDLNRAGVPLLEIVSEPDLRSGEEAYHYLAEVRKLVRYLDICDGNLEEGSMRCDANISVRLKGATEFGQKVEVKNMNSLRNVQRAIEFEIKRQVDLVEAGEPIDHETRTFNAVDGSTSGMRSKEEANDYRYFPEPDLLPLTITQDYIEQVRSTLPALPNELFEKYTSTYKLNEYDASVLTDSKEVAMFYEEVVNHTANYKSAANWVMTEVKAYLNEQAIHLNEFPLNGKQIADIIAAIDGGKISNSAASQKLFPALVSNPNKSVEVLAEELDIVHQSDDSAIQQFIQEVIDANPTEVERYKSGDKKLLGFFMGQLMKVSKGKADPKKSNQLIKNALDAL
jgi:aspartyl-tRNA(Asn)/glutamyl-tRNA(Gln) amidotransferase subunit B